MTLVLDTSALLALAVDGAQRRVVLDALDDDPVWWASALALTEALPAIDRLTDEPVLRADLEDAIRLTWDHLHVVPIDQRCLDRAANLSRVQPVRLTDAIHLAAAERMPGPDRIRHLRSRADRRRPRTRVRRGEQLTLDCWLRWRRNVTARSRSDCGAVASELHLCAGGGIGQRPLCRRSTATSGPWTSEDRRPPQGAKDAQIEVDASASSDLAPGIRRRPSRR